MLSHSEVVVPPAAAPAACVKADASAPKIVKPANDDMEYRHLVLPNGLRVMLVSDPTADKAGAAMDVCVGSLSDPDAFPGLAHFLEHMLFYSSEKYPVEDEYTKFISDRGGSTNAYTSAEHTNYHFDINWEALEGSLDRFAQFFISPTISADGIEREVRAVDSEHGKNLSSDAWRKSQVNKATANKEHPWARFSTGNRDTLFEAPRAAGRDPRGAVVDFHTAHYSADRCALCVLGRQGLDELEAMVIPMFSPIPNKQLCRPAFEAAVFLPDQVGVVLRVVPVREGQTLELVWQVPPSERLYREQPLGYLSHLLGHEGEGSVFALLKAQGWASALWAGESGGGLSFASFFTVHVELTEEGQRNIMEVASTVFRYIALVRAPGGINDRIWEEVRGLAQLHFDTRDKARPFSYTTSLAAGLQTYPAQDLLPALYGVPFVFDPAAVRLALEVLTPDRVRVFWISKAHEEVEEANENIISGEAAAAAAAAAGGDVGVSDVAAAAVTPGPAAAAAAEAKAGGGLLTEPVYGTKYDMAPLPSEWLAAWAAAMAAPGEEPRLHLPAPNPFIPTDLSLASDEAAAAGPHPTLALAVPGRLRLWHKPETRFGQPKAVLYLDVQCPEAYASPRSAVLTRLFVKLMLDYLNEVAYPAQQAGLDYNLLNTQSGWQLLLGGYNHKLPLLMEEVLGRLADFKVLPERFEFVREGLVREYANQLHNQPYSWAMYRAEMLTTNRRWPLEVYGGLAAEVTAEELQGFVKRLTSRCFVEGLAAGNMRREEAARCGGMLLAVLRDQCGAAPLHPCEAAELRVNRVPPVAEAAEAVAVAKAAAEAAAAAPTAATEAVGSSGGGGGGGSGGPLCNGWLYAEEGPSGRDENSAAVVLYQRGPDQLRRNALSQLLAQLTKRDAFNELRTRQQLGYIVSLHGGAEHGVGYLELLVQSNAHDADDLCRRMDDFIARLLDTDLPLKCGLGPKSLAEAETETEVAATTENSKSGETATTAANGPTEFETAVEELAKTKLEKPKKLADLTNRWWSEVVHGCYVFDRLEAEVAQLRSLTPPELLAFAGELLSGPGCRKLSVQVRGKAEAARAERRAAPAAAAAASVAAATDADAVPAASTSSDGADVDAAKPSEPAADGLPAEAEAEATAPRPRGPYAVIPASGLFEWKRGCESWPSVRATWAARRVAAGEAPLPASVGEREAAAVVEEAR